MFVSTFILGIIPMHIKVNLDLINIFGGGLLVGAAIIIIVPEGVKVLINSYKLDHGDDHHHHVEASEFLAGSEVVDTEGFGQCIGVSMALGFSFMLVFDEFSRKSQQHGEKKSVNSTTMGLVIHSISDGIALGVSLFCKCLIQ